MNSGQPSAKDQGWAVIIIVGVVGAFAVMCNWPKSPEQIAKIEAEEFQREMILDAHAKVRDRLKDPGSAQFGVEVVTRRGDVCGLVNAKNSFGGYNGDKPYVVTAAGALIMGDPAFPALYRERCA